MPRRRTAAHACLRACLFIAALLVLASGCAGRAPVYEKAALPSLPPPKKELTRTGFSIQAGAFANIQNASRLAANLERQGLSAYYFRHPSGLYKVRLGDFPTQPEARALADRLVQQGILDVYYIVSPEEYAVAKVRAYGLAGLRHEIVATAESFLGLPYQWGGSSPDEGFDCSGLAMAAYEMNGLNLPRTSGEQFEAGTPVGRDELARGDLVFFAVSGGSKVTHVGIYAGDGRFIHAPGKGKTIRTDALADAYYAKRYIGARTYL